jgi:beta-glucanase (GH16 family)
MRKLLLASIGVAALMFVSVSAKASYSTNGYALIWSDEFNGSTVDTSKWTPLNLPDNVNGSLEYYRPQNATVTNGYLNITGKQESFGGRSYTSASLSSFGKFSFTYGKAVARIQMPVSQGFWPAFWMIGNYSSSWPAQGEIDIMENINGFGYVVATSHWNNNGHQSAGGTRNVAITSFHDYELEWTPTDMIYRVDGVQYADVRTTNSPCFVAPTRYYFYVNMAIGGTWPGFPDASTPFPSTMLVDYVRVYQTNSGTGGTGGTVSLPLVNPSFETNTGGSVIVTKTTAGFDAPGNNLAGWLNAGSTYVNSGVDYAGNAGNIAQNGSVIVFCDQGDSGAYQIVNYPMQAGDVITLAWWAKSTYGNAGQNVKLLSAASTASLYASLTQLTNSTAALNDTGNGGAFSQYTLNYTVTPADAGRYVAVSFLSPGVAGAWATFDDFNLTLAPAPPTINVAIVGSQIQLNWPGIHTGWQLQAQTNLLGTGLGTNWVAVSGSEATNQFSAPIEATADSVFYRLVQP